MSRTCSVCAHPQRDAIDFAFIRGESAQEISAKFRVSPDAVFRHAQKHLPANLKQAHAAAQVAQADHLMMEVDGLKSETRRLMALAEKTGDIRTALAGIRDLTRLVELVARLDGNLKEHREVDVVINSPEWVKTRSAVLDVLERFPEARLAVAEVLKNDHNTR